MLIIGPQFGAWERKFSNIFCSPGQFSLPEKLAIDAHVVGALQYRELRIDIPARHETKVVDNIDGITSKHLITCVK